MRTERSSSGELLAMIDPRNRSESNVITKLGFTFWKQAEMNGFVDDLHRLTLP